MNLVPLVLALGVLTATLYWFRGFLQDDVFISLRYAYNLAHGNGLVFNVGERVEGFTNFAWTLFAALLLRLHIPPLPVLRFVAGVAAMLLVALTWWEAGGRAEGKRILCLFSGGLAGMVLGASTTLSVWTVSGLEQTFFALLVFAGYWRFARGNFDQALLIWCGAWLVRPEALLAIGLGLIVRVLLLTRGEALSVDEKKYAGFTFAFTFLFCGLRYLYYGQLVPNTFFVKGVTNWETHLHGWKNLLEFLSFNMNGVTLGLALWGLGACLRDPWNDGHGWVIQRRDALFSLLFILGYLYYMVRVGGEFLPFFRLYLPVLPFLALWAGRSLQFLRRWSLGITILVVAGLFACFFQSVQTSFEHAEFQGVAESLRNNHGAVGLFLELEAGKRPGTEPMTVIAQDMGFTPYFAPSVRFVDVIGLTDGFISRLLYDNNYTPYIRYLLWENPVNRDRLEAMEKKALEYLFRQNAEYVIINVDCGMHEVDKMREALKTRDLSFLLPLAQNNVFYYGLASTEKFQKEFELLGGYAYSTVHSLLLFKRRGA